MIRLMNGILTSLPIFRMRSEVKFLFKNRRGDNENFAKVALMPFGARVVRDHYL